MKSKLDSNTITYNNIPVSRIEYLILKTLIDNQGKVVSREDIVKAVWRHKEYGKTDALSVHIGHIRKKIPNIPIYSKSGFGYIYV